MSLISSVICCSAPEWFGGLFKQFDPPECCCSCCAALRPRYKRLVDNIFPRDPQDGLVKSNMEKLTFYALSSPEKLDRIGEYLARKVARDLYRHRNGYVVIAMDAMDQLLVACHAQTLNLFVESFLKIVQQLLESQETEMQLLATQSFVRFANIEEDTPSYHRRYDFFVSKFSSLCHNGCNDLEIRDKIRLAGLNGLKGVIRKTVSDDLQVNIWDETHMDKIVPSLLYNMQCQDGIGFNLNNESSLSSPSPANIAEDCLRELIARAAFGHFHSIIKPILKHLDNHQLWNSCYPNDFAVQTFKIIMYSIQAQHSYAVIQMLMSHLDDITRSSENTDSQIRVRTGIVNVLSNIVSISASESIGPSVLEMINSLLNHLRSSINNCVKENQVKDEKCFQETVINTLGEFANNLPDFQKIEIMIFIISKAPPVSATSKTDIQLQNIILKSLLKVTTKYKTVHMAQAFPTAFLNPLLSRALASDPKVRLTVQLIFHQLLDRHNNLTKLSEPLSLSTPQELTIEKVDRQDLMFIKKFGSELLLHIYENIQLTNNTNENFDAIYTTLALICVELNSEDTLTELLRLTFALQDLVSMKNLALTKSHKASIHCLVAGFLHLIANLIVIPAFCSHIEQVINLRREKTPWLLPELNRNTNIRRSSNDNKNSSPEDISDDLIFNKNIISEALQSSGYDAKKLLTPFMSRNVVDSSMTRSISDFNTITVEVDSANSSPGVVRRIPEQEITFESLRKVITEPISTRQEENEMRRLQIVDRFKNATFEDLLNRYERKSNKLHKRLIEAFNKFSTLQQIDSQTQDNENTPIESRDENKDEYDNQRNEREWHFYENPFKELCNTTVNERGPPLFALKFPDLFVY